MDVQSCLKFFLMDSLMALLYVRVCPPLHSRILRRGDVPPRAAAVAVLGGAHVADEKLPAHARPLIPSPTPAALTARAGVRASTALQPRRARPKDGRRGASPLVRRDGGRLAAEHPAVPRPLAQVA